jgi:transcriptional regulator with XRE-family HTH domain
MAITIREIRVLLVKHNKTGRHVAARVGLSPTAFSRLIHGHRRADPELLERIAVAIRARGGDDTPSRSKPQGSV